MTHEYWEWLAGEVPEEERPRVVDNTPYWLHVYNDHGHYMASDVYYGREQHAAAMRAIAVRCGLRVCSAQVSLTATRLIGETQWGVAEYDYVTPSGTHHWAALSGSSPYHEHHPSVYAHVKKGNGKDAR
jgi:hypothetical protein